MIKQIRVSSQARDQLIRLKSKTGIGQWNIICRWALAVSLKEPTPPTVVEIPADSNVEMSWQVFGGEYGELYWAAVKARCYQDGLATDDSTVAQQFRLHLHRGIGYLAAPNAMRSIRDVLALIQGESEES
jgi:DNA sulfur modification protein DndE